MPYDVEFWGVHVEDGGVEFERPTEAAVSVIGLLLQYAPSPDGSREGRRKALMLPRDIIHEVLSSSLLGWISKHMNRAEVSLDLKEPTIMSWEQETRNKSLEDEARLERILANEAIAEEAFPDPHVRNNVLQLITGTRIDAEKERGHS